MLYNYVPLFFFLLLKEDPSSFLVILVWWLWTALAFSHMGSFLSLLQISMIALLGKEFFVVSLCFSSLWILHANFFCSECFCWKISWRPYGSFLVGSGLLSRAKAMLGVRSEKEPRVGSYCFPQAVATWRGVLHPTEVVSVVWASDSIHRSWRLSLQLSLQNHKPQTLRIWL